MNYKITALAENTTYRHNVLAQHGQSLLIESDDYKLLFDVGEIPGAIDHNLAQMGIKMSEINDIAISHRHIDHIGALTSMLHTLTNQTLYLPLQLGEPDIKNHPEKYNFLTPNPDGGYDLAINKTDLARVMNYSNITLVGDNGFHISDGIYTTGCIGDWMQEQAIVIDQQEEGITVLVGCSHPTVEKLIEKAILVTGNSKVRGVIGGMHYTDFTADEMREHAHYLKSLELKFIVPSHCTTVLGAKVLQEELGDIVKVSKTNSFGAGNSVTVGEEVVTNFVG
jgi:7,8-dihydropterin-6-yl-methyl-4-(beta-D-ribofuranosyl)aminobenzene 5'-phosphate synthase